MKLLLILSVLTFGLYGSQGDDPPQPLFYGWFFDETVATSLADFTAQLTNSTYMNDIHFSEWIDLWLDAAQFPSLDPLEFYTKPLDPNTQKLDPYFHITSKYCGGAPCPEYEAKVASIINTTFETHLVGFIWSPRTFGVRVRLTPDQEDYFENGNPAANSSNSVRLSQGSSTTTLEDYPGLEFYDQDFNNLQPTSSPAHVTLGCAPNVSAVVTGQDAADVLKFEQIFSTMEDGKMEGYNRVMYVVDDPSKYSGTWAFYSYIETSPSDDSFIVYYPKQAIKTETRFEVYWAPPTGGSGAERSVSTGVAVLIIMVIIGKLMS